MAELLPDPVVEARAGKLREPAYPVREAHVEGRPGRQRRRRRAVDRDVDRLAARGIADAEHVAGSDDERSGGQRVGRDVADDVTLHSPGEDRSLVGEVVAGGPGRGRGDEPVAAHVADLLAGDAIAELRDAVVRPAAEADVVEGEALGAVDLDRQP